MSNTDDFTNVDGTQLVDHRANWTRVTNASLNDSGPEHTTIQSNKASVGSYKIAAYYYDAGQDEDTSSEIEIPYQQFLSIGMGPTARTNDTQNGYWFYAASSSGGYITQLNQRKNNAYAGTFSLAGENIADDVDHDWKIKATGTSTVTIKIYVDGVEMTSDTWTDSSSPVSGGYPGFAMFDVSGSQTFDNWADDSVAASGCVSCVLLNMGEL